ncbi:MAG: ParA family protein [Planctomycetes bacterium]|nr:ParA family protein [Planctomycetota bacterium]
MRTIAVLNQKGGVGKTTVAVNLACALSLYGKKVLLVDLDPQCNATISLSSANPSVGNIYTLLCGGTSLEQSITIISNNLHMLTSSIDLAGIEHELTPADLSIIKDTFVHVGTYDYIIFDCAPSLGLLILSCLTYVNEVFIPVQPEFFALNGLTLLLKSIDMVRVKLNPEIAITGIIFSMFEGRRLVTKEVVDEVTRHFGTSAFKTKIRKNVKLVEAQSYGKSIFDYDKESIGAKDFASLAGEVINQEVRTDSTIEHTLVINN